MLGRHADEAVGPEVEVAAPQRDVWSESLKSGERTTLVDAGSSAVVEKENDFSK